MKKYRSWNICLLAVCLLMGLAMPVGYLAWRNNTFDLWLFGFQPQEMALAQYTSKDVIGDLGGMKVRIPRHCAEYVEYDGDPGFGERRKGPVPERTFASKLSSFGIDARLPDMKCKENKEMRANHRSSYSKKNSPWIRIGINAGEIYPGAEAPNRHAQAVISSIERPTEFWFENYERLPDLIFGLDEYVVAGVDPHSGKPAKKSERTNDKFFHYDGYGVADTYIICGKTYVDNGVASCSMKFSMEPAAKVLVNVRFVRSRLSQWLEIRRSTFDLLASFKVRGESLNLLLEK